MADVNDEQAQRRALLASLRAAVEALTACVDAVYSIIEQVDAMAGPDDQPPATGRPRVSYGGGRSTLVGVPDLDLDLDLDPGHAADSGHATGHDYATGHDHAAGPGEAPVDPPILPVSARPVHLTEDPPPGASALMAAADMAHQGYTADEIAERLRLRWGDRAAMILRDLLD